MEKVASKYLFKQLSKTKRIAESPPFAHFKESKSRIPTDGPQSPAEANVLARLYKSNPVKNVLPGIMDGFRKILKLDEPVSAERTKKGQDGDKEEVKKPKDVKEKDTDTDAEDHDMEDASDDDDLAQFDSRLANSDSEEEEEEEDDDDDNDDHNDAMSITPSASPSLSPEPSPQPQPTKKPKQQASKPTPATSTTFLPSLSMGGYVSGSESEDPDAENDSERPVRKNRMGQQARRALWEKKYGAGARHVRAQKEKEKKDRDRGWDMKRGATEASSGGGRNDKKKTDGSRPRPQRDNNAGHGHGQKQGKKKEDDKPMHPSWEAARKAKEQKTNMAFQGQKVTFD